MRVVGLAGIVVGLLLTVGFVVAMVRADNRVHADDPAAVAGFTGLPRVLGVAAVVVVTLSLAVLTGEVFG